MVKFGDHLEFLRQEQRKPVYLVEYKKISALIKQEAAFSAAWREALKTAVAEYAAMTAALWQRVFSGISKAQVEVDELRGARPLDALRAYHALLGGVEAQKIIDDFSEARNTAVANNEALRKLVKKYDKEAAKLTDRARLSTSGCLLPELYSSAFADLVSTDSDTHCPFLVLRDELHISATAASVPVDEEGTRCLLAAARSDADEQFAHQHAAEDEPRLFNVLRRFNQLPGVGQIAELVFAQQMSHVRKWGDLAKDRALMQRRVEETMVGRRAEEVGWLRSMAWPTNVVAHRGFHSPLDVDRRPIENSLEAYEMAWTAGLKQCECDVAVTSDGVIVLGHDADYERLAMHVPGAKEEMQRRLKVGELTLAELMSMPLKSGSRPPLLTEVLRSAAYIGNGAKLVIEIKPGNISAVTALSNLFASNPQMLQQVAVVMSFDAFIMHEFARAMADVDLGLGTGATRERYHSKGMHRKASLKMAGKSALASARLRRSMNEKSAQSPETSTQRVSDPPLLPLEPLTRFFGGYMPKLLLLTVADKPTKPVELWLDITTDTSSVESSAVGLDGLYIEFQSQMLQPEGKEALRRLSKTRTIGVWGRAGDDPDDLKTLQELVESGVTFVNSDLPRSFFEKQIE